MGKEEKVKYNAVYSKKKEMVYISHLDLITLLRRALRRSGLPFVLSGGFTPRVKISTQKALRLGDESECEGFSFFLSGEMPVERITGSLNSHLPDGIRIYAVTEA